MRPGRGSFSDVARSVRSGIFWRANAQMSLRSRAGLRRKEQSLHSRAGAIGSCSPLREERDSVMSFVRKSKLPRLRREFYKGHASVLWTHSFVGRATGWLGDAFHSQFREVLLHAGARYSLACSCYVLMPDHWHLVWIGMDDSSDQRLATAFLRKHMAPALGACRLQDRAHDHVLREEECGRGAFQSACSYVLENPERAGLCQTWSKWPYLGAMVPGYPRLDPRDSGFWEDLWKIHNRIVEGDLIPALPRRATNSSSPLRKERDQNRA